MSYFLPSSLQKRVLRYALSRLELLDTDALDLEKLDILWGRKSTIELRDVGVHIEKISALLKLPPALLITKAKIATLRVTVPANLYQSSILLEVDGVDVGIRTDTLDGEELKKKEEKASQRGLRTPSKSVEADRPRGTPPLVHDPGGSSDSGESGEDEKGRLPTTLDLAQSFVLAEPIQERSELQAAVAHSLYLSHSQTSSEDDLNASEVGMGNDVSLPGFLAAYLKGVGDRVKVKIKDVKVDLILKLANKDDSQWVEDVNIRLAVGSVVVGEVSQDFREKQTRRIVTENIQLVVVSEQSLFSNLARSAAPSSPETTQASVLLEARSKSNQSSSPNDPNLSGLPTDDMEQSIADIRELQASVFSSQDGATEGGYHIDMRSPELFANFETAAGSLHQDSSFSDSFYSSGGQSSTYNKGAERSKPSNFSLRSDKRSHGSLSRQSFAKLEASQHSTGVQESHPATFNASPPPSLHNSLEQATMKSSPDLLQDVVVPGMLLENRDESSPEFLSPEATPRCPSFEDLTESKIFSHAQRESMYMSAMSGSPPSPSQSHPYVPGGWESSPTDKDLSEAEHPGMLESESHVGSHNVTRRPVIRKVDGKMLTEEHGLETSRSQTTFLRGDKRVRPTPAPCIDPALESGSAATDNVTASPQGSGSSSGSRRDPLILAKRILLIDSIIMDLPSGMSEKLSQFSDQTDPRVSSEILSDVKPDYDLVASSVAEQRPKSSQESTTSIEEDPVKTATVITIGNIQVVGDVGLTKLTILLVEKLSAIYQPLLPNKRETAPSCPRTTSRYILTVNIISWKFLDLVKGALIPDNAPPGAVSSDTALSEGADILLKSNIRLLHLDYSRAEHRSQTKVSIGQFSVGYANDNILSFDAGLKIKESKRDVSTFTDQDVVLTIAETKGILSVDVTTLPMHVVLDLRRLDETFSWFGGFSSMLGLGSSMMSTVTLLDPNAKASPSNRISRGVHFDSTALKRPPQQGNIAQQKKVTARIGGLVLDVQGAKSALRVDSTAMKLVSRTEGVGLQIDFLILNGPVTVESAGDYPIFAEVTNVRIEYLTTPKENDLTRLLTLLAPSKNTYDDEEDILVDTLIRQRKKGGVLRATIESADAHILDMQALQCFPLLAEEAKKLSTVAKYLPEDDRPGLLTLLLVKSLAAEARINDNFGVASFEATNVEIANITFPTLTAFGISNLQFSRNSTEDLVSRAVPSRSGAALVMAHPMIMARFIGNEMEPTVKIKVHNAHFEYYVTTVMDIMNFSNEKAAEEVVSNMISSVATLTSRKPAPTLPSKLRSQGSVSSNDALSRSKALRFDVAFRDTTIGLNPRASKAKGLIVLTDTRFIGSNPDGEDANASLEIRKAELMVIDDFRNVLEPGVREAQTLLDIAYTQVQALSETGYVSVSQISAAKVVIQVNQSKQGSGPIIDIEIKENLFVLETCADSTQTITNLLNGLKPPMPKSTTLKYQTVIVPVEDMLASFSGEAFEMDRASQIEDSLDFDEGHMVDAEAPKNLELVSSFYDTGTETPLNESMADSILDDDPISIASPSVLGEIRDKDSSESFQENARVATDRLLLNFQDDHFGPDSMDGDAAHSWDRKQNTPSPSKQQLRQSPLRVRIRDVHIIWNLFDGYDWQRTRDTIGQAVAEVQSKAIERQAARKRRSFDTEEEEEDVIGDFLFNSIYIGIPAKSDPAELARQVNRNIDDLVSETGSYATSTSGGASPSRGQPTKSRSKRLRLQRSKHHKLTFELKGVSADAVVFAPESGENESSIDIRVKDVEIFDHVPTSTWKKFATYMHDAGERESDTSMVHIEILNVKPVPNLAASEIVFKVGLSMPNIAVTNQFTVIRSPASPPCGPRRS